MTQQKFMMCLAPRVETQLRGIAKKRGISLQQLIRAEIVPTWLKQHNGVEGTIDIDKLLHLIQKYPLKRKATKK